MDQACGIISNLIRVIGNIMIGLMISGVLLFILMGIMMSGSGREYLDDKEDDL